MKDQGYIWIHRWGDFQSYQKKRGKPWAPPWIRFYLRQLDDDAYLDLTAAERGLLHDLRAEFARTRSNLRADRERLSQRLGYTVYARQLERLNQAGFITICSRTVLEQFRNAFWNSSGLEVEEEVEKEQDTPSFQPKLDQPNTNGASSPTVEPEPAVTQGAADDDIPF